MVAGGSRLELASDQHPERDWRERFFNAAHKPNRRLTVRSEAHNQRGNHFANARGSLLVDEMERRETQDRDQITFLRVVSHFVLQLRRSW